MLSSVPLHKSVVCTAAGTYLERFATFKRESGLSLLLPPVVRLFGVAHNDSPAVFIEAGVKVEGNIVPSLEI